MSDPAQPLRKIRYAVVGLGHIVQVAVLPAFANAENSQLVALISSDPERQQELSVKCGVKHMCSLRRSRFSRRQKWRKLKQSKPLSATTIPRARQNDVLGAPALP